MVDVPTGAKLVNSPLPPETPPGCGVPPLVPEEPPPTIMVTRCALSLPAFCTVMVSVNCVPGCKGSTVVPYDGMINCPLRTPVGVALTLLPLPELAPETGTDNVNLSE